MRANTAAGVGYRAYSFGLTLVMASILLGAAIPSFAQAPTGTILGVVKDASGGSISGATVTAVDTETGLTRTLTTADDGAYRFPALAVGHYSVKVGRSGFEPETHEGLVLDVSQEEVLNFTLEIGASTQEIVVTGEAPQVETTTATLGGTVNEQKMSDLPLNGRNYIELSLLQPGVTHAAMAGNITSKTQGTWMSSNGAPVRSNNITLDGARLNNLQGATSASPGGYTLGVDGIREYKVVTDMFGADYGLGMGSQVVMVSKSGSNQFHGDVFDYLRNDALDARNFFDTGSIKPPLRKNNFGGSFGGPIKKDKVFFYAVYEGIRETIGQSIHDFVLDASCYDPSTHQLLLTSNPCATLSSGNVAPSVQKIATLFPYPNVGTNAFTYPASSHDGENYGQIRFDQNISSVDSLFARFTTNRFDATNDANYPQYKTLENGWNKFLTVSENHIFSAQLVNTVRLSFSRTTNANGNVAVSGTPDCPTLACPGYSMVTIAGTPAPTGAINIQSAGANFGPTAGNYGNLLQNIYTASDDLFFTKGRHAIQFGILFNRFNGGTIGAASGANSVLGETAWGSPAAFLAGIPQLWDARVLSPQISTFFIFNTIGLYMQDDLRATSRLTLNLGLRYEFNTTPYELNGEQFSYRSIHTDLVTDTTHGPVMQNHSYKNLSPRIGFAYDVFGNGKTAVRGGFGEYFDVGNIGTALSQYSFAVSPLATFFTINPSVQGAPAFSVPFPVNIPSQFQAIHTLDYYAKQPHVLQYNLAAEHQLPWNMAMNIAYVGSRGINLWRLTEQNPNIPLPAPANGIPGQTFWGTDPSAPQGRINPAFTTATMVTTGSNSWYNSLQASLNMRAYHGLELQGSYTWSRNLDTAQGQQYVFDCFSASGSGQGTDPFNTRTDKGPTCFDVPNNLRLNVLYHFPNVKSGGFAARILNGWWVGNIISMQSGYAFNNNVPSLVSNSGVFAADQGDRPNYVTSANLAAAQAVNPNAVAFNHNSVIISDPNHWFNENMFTLVGPKAAAPCDVNPADPAGTLYGDTAHFDPTCYFGYLGNEGRNDLRGPHLRDWDLSINKDTALPFLGEAGKLEFRAEMFNLLNHPNFGMPNNATFNGLTSNDSPLGPGAGNTQVTQTATTARQIQLALKIIF
jgi:Carboxypeptidase regulatory-like domain